MPCTFRCSRARNRHWEAHGNHGTAFSTDPVRWSVGAAANARRIFGFKSNPSIARWPKIKRKQLHAHAEDLEAVAVESTRTIDIDHFVPRAEIDDLYNIRPYYIAPEGKVGTEAFVTIREAIEATGKVAIGRVVLSTRDCAIIRSAPGTG